MGSAADYGWFLQLRIPTVAIHLDRTQNEKTHYNTEQQLVPILGLASSMLNAPALPSGGATDRHTPLLLQTVAEHLQLQSLEQIEDFDLRLFDTQAACLGGANDEFIFAARIDNLFSTHAAAEALASTTAESLARSSTGRLIAIWDHEEVGSKSAVGAESNFLESTLWRLTSALKSADTEEEALHQTIANSFMVSSDMVSILIEIVQDRNARLSPSRVTPTTPAFQRSMKSTFGPR